MATAVPASNPGSNATARFRAGWPGVGRPVQLLREALHSLEWQSAGPDPRIALDEGPKPPVHTTRDNPSALVAKAADAPNWTTPHKSFPEGPEWEVSSDNAHVWAGHRFEGHFSERVLRLIGNPEGHPLFELRLDLLQYEVLFARFVGVPHNPEAHRLEFPRSQWRRTLVTARRRKPTELRRNCIRTIGVQRHDEELVKVAPQPQPWTPQDPHLFRCLQASCRDYAAGLAMYLLPGREHWGVG